MKTAPRCLSHLLGTVHGSLLDTMPNRLCSSTKRLQGAEPLSLHVSKMLEAVSLFAQEELDRGREGRPGLQPDLCAGTSSVLLLVHAMLSSALCWCGRCHDDAVLFVGRSLLDLPASLLSEITKHLDVCSQRNFFMTNSQLYSKWQLQIQPQDSDWHFLKRSLDILVASKDGDPQNLKATGIRVHSQKASWAQIACLPDQCAFMLDIKRRSSSRQQKEGAWFHRKLTSEQLWHKLASMPRLSSATLLCKSQLVENAAAPEDQLQLKALTQGLFTLLLDFEGHLVVQLPSIDEDNTVSGPDLMIRHGGSSGPASWSMDYEPCISKPPALHWDCFPQQVRGVHAVFVSRNTPQDLWTDQYPHEETYAWCEFDPSVMKTEFAYKGNVDINAWISKQHDRADDWMAVHQGMDDEDYEEMYGEVENFQIFS